MKDEDVIIEFVPFVCVGCGRKIVDVADATISEYLCKKCFEGSNTPWW